MAPLTLIDVMMQLSPRGGSIALIYDADCVCTDMHTYIHTYIHTCALLDFPKCLTAAEASPVAQKPVCGGNHTGLKV